MQASPAISTAHLSKRYGRVEALSDLTLDVQPGEIFGFLGPNGAGKSTTIRTLLGFLHASGGSASVLGHDVATQSVEIRKRIGYLPGGIDLYESLSGAGLLDYLADLQGRAPSPTRGAVRADAAARIGPQAQGARLLARHASEDRRDPGAAA